MEVLAMFKDGFMMSPFVVPVAGCAMVLGIVIASMWGEARKRELQAQERLAAIAAGQPVPHTPEELAILHGKPAASQTKRRANIRLSGIVLLAVGFGLVAFFVALAAILRVREVLCGAAVGLIPLAIGVGFLIDTRIQTREIEEANSSARLGSEA